MSHVTPAQPSSLSVVSRPYPESPRASSRGAAAAQRWLLPLWVRLTGGRSCRDIVERGDFWSTTSNKHPNFVQHVKTLLKQNGRAAVVVPDNVLFEGGAGETIRRKLLHECDVLQPGEPLPAAGDVVRRKGTLTPTPLPLKRERG